MGPSPAWSGPVVVGTDGSDEAARGVRFAAALADRLGVELVVAHSLGLLSRGVDWHASHEQRAAWAAEQLAGAWTDFLAELPHGRRTVVVDGPDADGLLRAADDVEAAVIVVGSHGSGGSADPFLGSTSHRVVASSHRPVLVVPPEADHLHGRSTSPAAR